MEKNGSVEVRKREMLDYIQNKINLKNGKEDLLV